ncbi:hypothetical protein M1146_06490 [Patescibacteria group bacterium]|nr:hypothetical protein [Patescibacteria group bacterium]
MERILERKLANKLLEKTWTEMQYKKKKQSERTKRGRVMKRSFRGRKVRG